MMKWSMFLCLSLTIFGANSEVSFIDPCHYADSECNLKSAQKALPFMIPGLPDLGVPSFNPLVINDVNGDTGELKLRFKDMVIKDLAKCEITKVERPEKLKAIVELVCPVLITGHYLLAGKFYVINIEGEGDFEFKTAKAKILTTINLKVIEKNGEEYYKITNFDFKYELLKKVFYTFHNLYNGDKVKAEPVNTILDQNWREITDEIGKPVIKEMITQVVNGIGKFLTHVPSKQLEL